MNRHVSHGQVKGVSTGTTILAVKYAGGVIIGSDSRASMGESYVSSKVINKLVQVHDRIFCCMAGSLADAQAITRAAKFQLAFHSIQMDEPPLVMAAASIMQELCYQHKEELSAGFITAGWDRKKGPQVYSVSLGGMLVSQPFTIGGSGSTYIYGYVDAKYKPGMTREECQTFAVNALALAMGRDNVSGGVAHLAIISEKGVEHVVVPGNKLPKFNDK
ncbi:proteasome subunit beta type-6-A like protein-like isoform X1 [Myxocyprinus asiaticus]|uniref:proteasome subunit beta type-6-A like protein-like isoform X1 n=1 Tax=Myxocyprinus asiaticus TaxID=70543 RepID=UPI002222E1DE|nr:proteasome subunit beta type-6-A like protein-like isoform X1 [Myxocyprinus asiaticus]